MTKFKEYTYGEVEFSHFIALLKYTNVNLNSVFWDLGCGIGKAMICAALSDCKFSKICGVEILEGLYNKCHLVIDKFRNNFEKSKAIEFKVIQGDIEKVDWLDADLIYFSSICLSDEVI